MNGFPLAHKCFAAVLPLLLCSGCATELSEKHIAIIKSLEETIASSTRQIAQNSTIVLASLENKRYEPATHYKAELWYPKALLVQKYSAELSAQIQELRSHLAQKAASAVGKNKGEASQLLLTEGKAKLLLEQCTQYRARILSIDSNLRQDMEPLLMVPGHADAYPAKTEPAFADDLIQASPEGVQALLTQLENRVKTTEYRLLMLFHDQFTSHRICTFNSPIVTQSSSAVRAGQEIQITAGVGALIAPVNFSITIDGKSVPMAEDVAARYTLRASTKAGKHAVPVLIEYTDQDGKVNKVAKHIEYTVIKE